MIEELVEHGYAEASVPRALAAAGLPADRGAEFGDKDAILFAAYDELSDELLATAAAECGGSAPWPDRIRIGLGRLLEELAARPRMAKALIRSFPAIRPQAYERYVALLSRFVPLMREGREYCEAAEELPDEVELLAVGSAEAIIFAELDAGRAEQLPEMLPEILFSVLVPFLGPEQAADEMRSAAAIG